MEITSQGYNRCLKQESAQRLTWVGNPETRFTFDHVACETIDQVQSQRTDKFSLYPSCIFCNFFLIKIETFQETLFKMVGLPMVENCLSGYNSCMFAYGQVI